MAHLRQKRGIWYVYFYHNGKLRGISLRTKDKNEAEKLAREKIKTITSIVDDITYSELLVRWLNEQRSDRYKKDAQRFFDLFCDFVHDIDIKNAYIKDTERRVREYVKQYALWLKSNYSNSYVGIQLRTLRALFNWALKEKYATIDFFENITIPKTDTRIDFLSTEDIVKLLNAIDNPLHREYVKFLLLTGCRRGELYNLKWVDIHEHYIIFRGKTGTRRFPIQEDIRHIINRVKELLPVSTRYFYAHHITGQRYSEPQHISKMVRYYMRKAGLPETYSTHTLRHTFASQLIMRGVPIYTVSKLLGHKSVKTTEIYAHLLPEYINADINYLDGIK